MTVETETQTRTDRRLRNLENGLAALSQHTREQFTKINSRLDTIETRLDTIETRLDTIETRLDTIETKVDEILRRLPPP